MTEYKIASIKMQNFCGIKSLDITPNGADLSIYGDNATGKTTIANAFAWLFTGKNAAGTADFDPAPLDGGNGKIHNLETSVAVKFTDGTEYRRVLTEVWTKKRGEVTAQLKVALLDERINSRFRTLKFKLFHEQQNGGLQEICKVLIPCESGLVEYEKANNAAQINAGIEIINVLADYYDVRLPMFVDNAESVTALTASDGQVVRLVVSEHDKSLRFDV